MKPPSCFFFSLQLLSLVLAFFFFLLCEDACIPPVPGFALPALAASSALPGRKAFDLPSSLVSLSAVFGCLRQTPRRRWRL